MSKNTTNRLWQCLPDILAGDATRLPAIVLLLPDKAFNNPLLRAGWGGGFAAPNPIPFDGAPKPTFGIIPDTRSGPMSPFPFRFNGGKSSVGVG